MSLSLSLYLALSLSLSVSSPPESRVPDIGSDLEEGENAREDNHRVGKEVICPRVIISFRGDESV